MNASICPLDKHRHANIAIVESSNYLHLQGQHLVPVVFHEFVRLAAEYPLAFVKNSDTGQLQAIALLGLMPGENLFFSHEGWQSRILPGIVKHYPFVLIPDKFNPEQWVLGIHENNKLSAENGHLLFTAEGEETPWLDSRKKQLAEYHEQNEATKIIIDFLSRKKLFRPQTLTVKINDQTQSINGIYSIDAEALQSMDDSDFLELRSKGFLPPIYAQMASLQQLQKLVQMKLANRF